MKRKNFILILGIFIVFYLFYSHCGATTLMKISGDVYTTFGQDKEYAIDVQDFGVDSIKVTLFNDVIDISVKFVGDSNIVYLNVFSKELNSHLSITEQNNILNCIDSLCISKATTPIKRKIRIKEWRMFIDPPFLNVSVFKGKKESKFITNETTLFNNRYAYLFSESLFKIIKILTNKYQEFKDHDFISADSPEEALINYLKREFAPDEIPHDILEKIHE